LYQSIPGRILVAMLVTQREDITKAPPLSLVARCTPADLIPWVPQRPGVSFQPLRFLRDDRGWVSLIRVEPGIAIARHRHTGEVHAYNLQGHRKLGTGELVGPGGYVYEPPGNIDTWAAVGDTPLIVYVSVYGAVEYLDGDNQVTVRISATTQHEIYRRHCEAQGIEVLDLFA
jgi:2,4'-dihydroxyacetophenone dioxygenase